jgi:DNA repair exonuclease SbcCD ATPase subunit
LIPLILLVIIGGFYLLSCYLERKTQEDFKGLRSELRSLQSSRRELEGVAAAYSPDDPEPFGSRVEVLQAQLLDIGEQARYLERRHVSLQEEMHKLASNRWRTTMGAPFFWYSIRKGITRLRAGLEATREAINAASELAGTFATISWELALQAREVHHLQGQASQLLKQLRARNLQGDSIEAATQGIAQCETVLSQIPGYFLEGEQVTVLEGADINDTALVNEILEDTQPLLDQLWKQAQTWEKGYDQASDRVAVMRRLLDEVEQTMGSMPSELEIIPFKNQFEGLQIVAQNLHATLTRLEVESIEMVTQEATRVAQIARDMGGQLKRARRELAALEGVLAELSEGLGKLPLQLAALGAKSAYPVEWTQSFEKLADLGRQAKISRPVKESRTPEQVQDELALATKLRVQLKELSRHYEQVEAAHTELLRLLKGPEFSHLTGWLANAQRVVEQVQAYAPDNWPRSDTIKELPGEVEAMAEGVQRLMPADQARPVPETEVAKSLEEARELADAYQKLKKRVENVQTRLSNIQGVEKQALETLKGSQTALNQIIYIVRSNAFLAEFAEREANRLQDDVQGLLAEFVDAQLGIVEKKARHATTLVARVEQNANQWLDQLNQDTRAAVQDLSTMLNEIGAIAPLEEPAVDNARHLLASGPAFDVGGFGGKSRFSLDELVQEFKRRNDYWQMCAAAISALQDVDEPLIKSYEGALLARTQTQGKLANVSNWLRQNRGWPPTSISLETERQELEKIEAQWEALPEKRFRAITLVQHLGDLSAKYQTLTEKIRQSAGRAENEMLQVEELEAEINDLAQLWENHWYAQRDNPIASQEIRELLEAIDHEQAQIRQQYKKGDKSYSQVLEALKALHRKIKHFKAALDEDHAIDVSGRVNTRR